MLPGCYVFPKDVFLQALFAKRGGADEILDQMRSLIGGGHAHVLADELPKCTETRANYFEQENVVFSSRRKLQSYVVRQIKNGAYMLYFRLEGKLKAREVASEISDFALGILYDRGETQLKCYQMINDAANTCRISFR